MSILDYINKYGDYSFDDREFNEVDNVILSVLSYIDFDGIVLNKNKISVKEAGDNYFKIHSKKLPIKNRKFNNSGTNIFLILFHNTCNRRKNTWAYKHILLRF